MNRIAAPLALALALCSASAPAFAAGPSADAVATARTLYNDGTTALQAGDVEVANERLAAAWALVQTPVIGIAYAEAQVKAGKLVEAREVCIAVGRVPVAPEETARSAAARKSAEELAAKLLPRLAHLTVRPVDGATEVDLDGAAVPSPVLGVPRLVNPGAHALAARTADGRTTKLDVVLAEGETKEVALPAFAAPTTPDVPRPTGGGSGTGPVTPPTTPPDADVHTRPSPLAWVGFGVAGAGAVVGAITGAIALSEASTVRSVCQAQLCLPDDESHLHNARNLATVSTIAFVVAGVGLGAGIVGLLIRVPVVKAGAVRAWPLVGAGTVGVGGTF